MGDVQAVIRLHDQSVTAKYSPSILTCVQEHCSVIVNLHNYIYTVFILLFLLLSDSSLYAHYVFKAFDVNSNGAISFRVSSNGLLDLEKRMMLL